MEYNSKPRDKKYLESTVFKKIKEDFDLIHTLMGNDVKSRKDFIFENAINVSNLDI